MANGGDFYEEITKRLRDLFFIAQENVTFYVNTKVVEFELILLLLNFFYL